ncbi:MAG: YceI family protein [Deltaproteobacteria bacterium]|nr:YceI family protein [Deltaproteobacteria bacterium]MBI3293102.1 YceI family protein [Deltaproteobacteria bacterium]
MTNILRITAALLFVANAFAATTWKIDTDHSIANFKIKHLVVSNVTGSVSFTGGQFEIDEKDFTKTKMEGTLDPKTINTSNEKRDGHLKSADFFDVAKNPTIKFVSKKIEADGAKYRVTGDLTLHGVTKAITLFCEKPTDPIKAFGGQHRGFSATGKINRKDFGMVWNKALETGGLAVGEELEVSIDLELAHTEAPSKKT